MNNSPQVNDAESRLRESVLRLRSLHEEESLEERRYQERVAKWKALTEAVHDAATLVKNDDEDSADFRRRWCNAWIHAGDAIRDHLGLPWLDAAGLGGTEGLDVVHSLFLTAAQPNVVPSAFCESFLSTLAILIESDRGGSVRHYLIQLDELVRAEYASLCVSKGPSEEPAAIVALSKPSDKSTSSDSNIHASIENLGPELMRGSFSRDKKHWTIQLGPETFRTSTLRGVEMLYRLVVEQGDPVSVAKLDATSMGAGWTAESIQSAVDKRYEADVVRETSRLRSELQREEERGAADHVAEIEGKMEQLAKRLKADRGKHGPRKLSNEHERARDRVRKALKKTMERLSQDAPGLHAHFDGALKDREGYMPCYRPSPSVRWMT